MNHPNLAASIFRIEPQGFSPHVEVASCFVECEGKFLFMKRAVGTLQENTWGIPAGKMKKGETARGAAFRETFEEVGIQLDENKTRDVAAVFVLASHADFVFYMFHQKFSSFPPVHLSHEHQEYLWVTLEEALELPLIAGAPQMINQFKALANKPILPRKDFYFIRHGETDCNADPHFKNMDNDLPLNAKGKAQAFSAHNHIRKFPFKSVFYSPIQRARETKEILLNGLEMHQVELQDLSECKAHIWTKMIKLEEGTGYHVCEDVESFLFRALQGVSTVLEEEGPTLVVAHGGIHWALCYLMMIENHPWKIGNCQLVHFRPVGTSEWTAEIILEKA